MQYVLGCVDLHFRDSLIDEIWLLGSKQDTEDMLKISGGEREGSRDNE